MPSPLDITIARVVNRSGVPPGKRLEIARLIHDLTTHQLPQEELMDMMTEMMGNGATWTEAIEDATDVLWERRTS